MNTHTCVYIYIFGVPTYVSKPDYVLHSINLMPLVSGVRIRCYQVSYKNTWQVSGRTWQLKSVSRPSQRLMNWAFIMAVASWSELERLLRNESVKHTERSNDQQGHQQPKDTYRLRYECSLSGAWDIPLFDFILYQMNVLSFYQEAGSFFRTDPSTLYSNNCQLPIYFKLLLNTDIWVHIFGSGLLR